MLSRSFTLLTCLYLLVMPPLAGQEVMTAAAHWQKFAVPTQASLRGLSVPRGGMAWASGTGATILRTTDNGQTWRHMIAGQNPDLDFRDVVALDADRAWVMGAGTGPASCIWFTESGGREWRQLHVNVLADAFYDGMVFHEGKGLVYSDPVEGAFLLLQGDDQSWARLQPKTMPPALKGEASFAASGTGLVRRGDHIWFGTGGAATARVFHSADKGATWTAVATPLHAGSASSGVFSIAFRDLQHGVIVGGRYDAPEDATATAATTIDGGVTWQLGDRLPGGYRSCVAYLPGTTSLITVGTTGTDYSNDDGRTWHPLDTTPLTTVAFGPSAKTGWAVGPNGTVAHLRLDPN